MIERAVRLIDAGEAEELEGRGVNRSYRLIDGDRVLSVKAHCAATSAETDHRRIRRVDEALSGTDWYPPVLDIGYAAPDRLVVIRPFVPGAASEDAARHLDVLAGVLGELAAGTAAVPAELVWDYATPWLTEGEREQLEAKEVLTGEWDNLLRAMDEHLGDLLAAALRLTGTGEPALYHGDLHGRNLIWHESRPLTVIDWDETGFSHRPADIGKALWLSCRKGRGDFELDPSAVRRFLALLRANPALPTVEAADLARLGAIWFLPRYHHVTLLAQRDAEFIPWYLGWVSRFWARFPANLDLVSRG
ncbi:phosphotransferase [Crossiella sp. CA-258035]|uniref:phosphotransferase n=1 Tax=Crossiella sp. CA-258035 TaxID=2981138 RepID=UPI0024BC8CE9|nr:phosphotransferase [Crossiella sp. CA-258035]WHT16348.1 phosphotransferase [Crossiella sp. CA-258035]